MIFNRNYSYIKKTICVTLTLVATLLFIRIKLVNGTFWVKHFKELSFSVFLGYKDVEYALGLGTFFVILFLFIRGRIISKILFVVYVLLAIISILWALINIEAVTNLNIPLNYNLLYYADIFNSHYVFSLVDKQAYESLAFTFVILSSICLFFAWLLWFFMSKNLNEKWLLFTVCSIVIVFALYFYKATKVAHHYLAYNPGEIVKILNPEFYFFRSLSVSNNTRSKFFSDAAKAAGSIRPGSEFNQVAHPGGHAPTDSKIKNVVIFVLESTPAKYIYNYFPAGHDVTPNLLRHQKEAILFKNIYAITPGSTNTLFTLFTSLYPLISFKNVIIEKPEFKCTTLSSVFAGYGYKTGFFSGTDNSYCRVDEFLEKQHFSKIVDFKSIPCATGITETKAEGASVAVSDMCTVQSFLNWVGDAPAQPFFSVLWTVQTHWPYFTYQPQQQYVKDNEYLNRYLNALHETDIALENLLKNLAQKGLSESTLVVVVGDHGEGFGEHQQYGHGSDIYEESIHVPLLFINPVIGKGQVIETTGSHMDVGPTILDILGKKAPPPFEGYSLFDPSNPDECYFFSTWSDYLFGYRKGNFKYIYNTYNNKMKVFNLKNDPMEKTDLSSQYPVQVDSVTRALGYWYEHQRSLMKVRLEK